MPSRLSKGGSDATKPRGRPKNQAIKRTIKRFRCGQCRRRFALKRSLDNHVKTHLRKVCNNCAGAKAFTTMKDLCRHSITHTNERPWKCGVCSTTFPRKDNLRRHIKARHPAENLHKCMINAEKGALKYVKDKLQIKDSVSNMNHSRLNATVNLVACISSGVLRNDLARHCLSVLLRGWQPGRWASEDAIMQILVPANPGEEDSLEGNDQDLFRPAQVELLAEEPSIPPSSSNACVNPALSNSLQERASAAMIPTPPSSVMHENDPGSAENGFDSTVMMNLEEDSGIDDNRATEPEDNCSDSSTAMEEPMVKTAVMIFICPECQIRFASADELEEHKRGYLKGFVPFACHLCSKSFTYYICRNSHLAMAHGSK